MELILHIAQREAWEQAKLEGRYDADTRATQGFIHCSTPQQIIKVANALYHGQKELVLLCIDPKKVNSKIRWEGSGKGEEFPHIYGPIDLHAIIKVVDFQPGTDGKFSVPPALVSLV